VILGFVTVGLGLWLCVLYLEHRRKTKAFERELERKNKELQDAIAELKRTQVRLIESGKVSAAAALSAGILHQISQPITAIHGFVRFMKQEMSADNTFYRPVCLMDEQSVYLKEMLNNLMVLIRHRKIEKVATEVNAVVERSLSLLADELRIRRVNWDQSFDKDIPKVLADPIHLQQVFMNITVNACEALASLPRGQERSLHVSTNFDTMKHEIKVTFKDNGPGIPAEIKAHIFEPFFSTKTTGAGIGLALCHDLVAEHGGVIKVDSGSSGTTFVVILPVETLS
jgi:signal transduction histidine kinase